MVEAHQDANFSGVVEELRAVIDLRDFVVLELHVTVARKRETVLLGYAVPSLPLALQKLVHHVDGRREELVPGHHLLNFPPRLGLVFGTVLPHHPLVGAAALPQARTAAAHAPRGAVTVPAVLRGRVGHAAASDHPRRRVVLAPGDVDAEVDVAGCPQRVDDDVDGHQQPLVAQPHRFRDCGATPARDSTFPRHPRGTNPQLAAASTPPGLRVEQPAGDTKSSSSPPTHSLRPLDRVNKCCGRIRTRTEWIRAVSCEYLYNDTNSCYEKDVADVLTHTAATCISFPYD